LGNVRLAHPLEVDESSREAWRASLQLPPAFEQLGRTTYHADHFSDVIGVAAPLQRFSRWRRRNRWFHGEPMDAGIVYTDSLHLLSRGLVVTLSHSGYGIGDADFEENVRVLGVDLADLDGAPLEPLDLDPVLCSELLLQLWDLQRDENE
jgi:hypothetical protein